MVYNLGSATLTDTEVLAIGQWSKQAWQRKDATVCPMLMGI